MFLSVYGKHWQALRKGSCALRGDNFALLMSPIFCCINVCICSFPSGPQPSPPRNVSARLTEPGKVYITWAPPINSTVPVFYYVIQSRHDEGIWEQIHKKKIKVPQTFYTWESMKRGVAYDIRVLSFGVLAYSQPSNAVNIYVPAPQAGECEL